MALTTIEDERRALALFERLADHPGDARLRARLTARESPAVCARLAALEASVTRAAGAMPTLIPGSLDGNGVVPPPERIGAFRLTERIGRGGMGDVWAAVRADGLFEQKVAVKLIQRHALARAAAAFDDERRFLARLEHPAITRLIDGGITEDGLPWLAMEFFEGVPIDQACQGKADAAMVALFCEAAGAVQFAHGKMIAHADIKPSNIIVDAEGRVKLLDFGIAQLIGHAPAERSGSGPVTRDFASPERLAGGGASVADDVFALGKTLALLLTGRADRELHAIAAKASAADEPHRYDSVAALIADLGRWQARLPVSAMPDSWRYRSARFIARHRSGVTATAIALLLLGATALVASISYVRAEAERRQAETRYVAVRSLAHYLLFDLYDMLARQPGTVAKRAQIAATAAHYLEGLRVGAQAPPALLLDTARSYRRLAAIEGLPYLSNLGDPKGAGQALDRAAALIDTALRQQPRDAALLAERGWIDAERWSLAADNPASPSLNRLARQRFEAALAIDPGNAAARLGLLVTEKSRAYDLIWSANRPAEALPILRRALTALRGVRWPDDLAVQARSLEVNMLNRLGDATYYAGDIPGSLAPYRAAEALIDAARARGGATPQLEIAKAEAAFNISGSLGDMGGRDAEALAVADAGAERIEALLRMGPDAAAEKRLLMLYGEQALLLGNLKRTLAAVTPSAKSVALREARLARAPDNPQRMRDLAVGAMPHAELLAAAGRTEEACRTARRGEAMWQAIARRGELSAFDRAKNLPRSGTMVKKLCSG